MKSIHRLLICFLLFLSNLRAEVITSIPSDMLGTIVPEKKMHNRIFSSVKNKSNLSDNLAQLGENSFDKSASSQASSNLDRKFLVDTKRVNSETFARSPQNNNIISQKDSAVDKENFKDVQNAIIPNKALETNTDTSGLFEQNTTKIKQNNFLNAQKSNVYSEMEQMDSRIDENQGVLERGDVSQEMTNMSSHIDTKQASDKYQEMEKMAVHADKVAVEMKEKKDQEKIIKLDQEYKKDHEGFSNQGPVLQQAPGFVDDQASVSFNFEETDLANVAAYMENIHKIKFVSEDIISTNKDAKGLAGHKITFRTNKVLTKKESWDLFLAFLHIAGLDIVPMTQAGFYKIVPFSKANSETVPSYIGLDVNLLPDNDMIVRYVYFMKNIEPKNVQPIISKMQGGSAKLDVFSELKALIFTDRACNIKSLMQIVNELDQAVTPETLSVVKLKKANVDDVIKLYKSLKSSSSGSSNQPNRVWAPGKKDPSLEYFPQDVSTIGDSRTNSLILLGPEKGVKRIEEFIEKYVDIDINRDTPPVFTYQLQYTTADYIQPLLNKIVSYGNTGGSSGASSGNRDGIQYFQQMTIVAEKHSNQLIINSTKEDFEALKPLIAELDIPQKQVGIEVLIVQVSDSDVKTLGSQLSMPKGANAGDKDNETCQTFAQSISAQTSGILASTGQSGSNVVVTKGGNSEEYSIKSSLAKLLGAGNIVNEAGSILVTFGKPIWSIFKILKKITSTHVLANPFVVVSNNSPASVSIGEERRIVSSATASANSDTIRGFSSSSAALGFQITPQINKGNIVNMQIKVNNDQFTGSGENSALKNNKVVDTYASVASGEVLVIGGIMTESYSSCNRGVPFLENIPLLGWFFKSKNRTLGKDHFLIFISPRLLDPLHDKENIDTYTKYKMNEAEEQMKQIDDSDWFSAKKDPIQRAFFGTGTSKKFTSMMSKDGTSVKSAKKVKPQKEKKQSSKPKRKAKKQKNQEEVISFDKDFLHTDNNTSHKVKNSILNSMQQGGSSV